MFPSGNKNCLKFQKQNHPFTKEKPECFFSDTTERNICSECYSASHRKNWENTTQPITALEQERIEDWAVGGCALSEPNDVPMLGPEEIVTQSEIKISLCLCGLWSQGPMHTRHDTRTEANQDVQILLQQQDCSHCKQRAMHDVTSNKMGPGSIFFTSRRASRPVCMGSRLIGTIFRVFRRSETGGVKRLRRRARKQRRRPC